MEIIKYLEMAIDIIEKGAYTDVQGNPVNSLNAANISKVIKELISATHS